MSNKTKVLEIDSPVPSTPEHEGAEPQSSAPVVEPKKLSRIEELEQNANKLLDDPTYDPMQGPSALFGLYGPYLFKAVDQMSNKQLKRLIKVLVTYPLEDIKLNKKNALEVEAFKIADRMLQSKYLMQLIVYHEEEEKRKASQQPTTEVVDSGKEDGQNKS
jgi:hypothetical protein